jgi:hypothetical protein
LTLNPFAPRLFRVMDLEFHLVKTIG